MCSKCFLFDIVSQVRAARNSPSRLPSTAYLVHGFTGTIRTSDCLYAICLTPFLVVRHTTPHTCDGAYRLSPVDAPLLYCMNGSHQHRQAHASIAIIVRMYIDFHSDQSVVPWQFVFRCSIAIPTAMLFTLRNIRYRIPRKTRFRCRGSRLVGWAFPTHYVKHP